MLQFASLMTRRISHESRWTVMQRAILTVNVRTEHLTTVQFYSDVRRQMNTRWNNREQFFSVKNGTL